MKKFEERVTLASLARELNVTTATVCKVLAGKKCAGEEMQRKVLELAKKRNYTPNVAARMLKTSRSDTIGVLFTSDVTNVWYAQLASHIENQLSIHNRVMLLTLGKNDVRKIRKMADNFLAGRVAGVIVGPVFTVTQWNYVRRIAESGLPMICFGGLEDLPGSFIRLDAGSGAEKAVDYLVACGHEKIAMLHPGNSDSGKYPWSRIAGFARALKRHSLDERFLVGDFSGSFQSFGYCTMKKFLTDSSRGELPTAIFCHNDETAFGAAAAIREAGLSVPEDISLVGYDGLLESVYQSPPLTTLGEIMDVLAEKLVKSINELIAEPDKKIYSSISPNLIIRNSVAIR